MTQPVPAPPPVETVPMQTRDGATVHVPASQAAEAYRSGDYGFAPGTAVPLDMGDGEAPRILSGQDAAATLDKTFTAKTTTREAVREGIEEKHYGGVGQAAGAAAIGGLNALTLGFGKGALIKGIGAVAGPEMEARARANTAALERQQGAAMGLGEAAGFLAPLAFSGGTSALAQGGARGAAMGAGRVATAPLRAAGLLGEAAGGLAERAAVRAGATEGGALASIARGAGAGAAEMPLFEVGNAVSRAVVRDEPLTAEQLFAAGGHGLLLGAGFGGGLSAAGQLLSGTGRLARRAGEKAVDLGESIGFAKPGTLAEVADRKAIQAVGASLGQVQKLGPMEGAFAKRTAEIIREELPGVAGRPSLAGMSRKEMAEAVPLYRKKVGEEYDSLIGKLDKAKAVGEDGLRIAPNLGSVAEGIIPMEQALAKSLAPDAYAATVGAIRSKIQEVANAGPVSFKKAIELKGDLQKIIRKSNVTEGTVNEYRQQIVDLIDGEIARAGTQASGAQGAEWAARYTRAKQDYAVAKWLDKATQKGAAREANNRTMGFSEQVGMVSGGIAGAATAAAVGGLPGLLAHGALQIGSAVAHNLVRRHGDQVVAAIAGKAVKSDLIHAIGETVSETIGARAAGFVDRARLAVKLAPTRGQWGAEASEIEKRGKESSGRETAKRFREQQQAIASFDPASLETKTAGLADQPGLRAAIVAQTVRAHDFLQGKLPEPAPNMHPLQRGEPRPPSPAAIAKFGRYAQAVEDPLSVVDDMRRGRITREGVDALRTVYPAIYEQAKTAVLSAMHDKKKPLSWEEETQLGILLGVSTSPLQDPAAVRAMQAAYATPPPAPAASNGGSLKPLNLAGPAQTASQKLTSGA